MARHDFNQNRPMTNGPQSAASTDVLAAAAGLSSLTTEVRRAIHQDPEIGLQLPNTQQRVLEALTGLGLDITTGESTTSVVADLDTGRDGPTVLLRGDMDALPLQEDHPSAFRSTIDGCMHACGHDAHTAMLVSAAHLLTANSSELRGRVRFMFQPGEEGFHGARYMIEEGVLDGVDRAFALHVLANLPDGVVFSRAGSLMASADKFQIWMQGRGGHASMPHHTIDPIPAAAATVGALSSLVSREVDAANAGVVTVAHIAAGTTNNVIPPEAFMEGTIRTLDPETRNQLRAGVARVAEGTAAAHGCACRCEIEEGYPVTVNDPVEAATVGAVTADLLGEERFVAMPSALMGAEDWSYVLNRVPGSMAFLGACPPDLTPAEAAPNHSNLMRLSEDHFHHGVGLYAAMAMAEPARR